jgi:hypothetical protein
MPQFVQPFDFSEDALRLREFIFEYWSSRKVAPNLRNICEAIGFDRRRTQRALKELQLGIIVVVNQESQNCDILKAPPFSSFPSQAELYIDDEFHSYIGCASEAMAVSNMPPFQDKECRIEAFAPVVWRRSPSSTSHSRCCPVIRGAFYGMSTRAPGIGAMSTWVRCVIR